MRVKCHPTLGILVGTDGHVMVPATRNSKAHWTFGCKDSLGYFRAQIYGKPYKTHRLVAETYIPNPENKTEVDHIDRVRNNNNVENLRWSTSSENRRNRADVDRVDARGGAHKYENEKQYMKEWWTKRSKTHKYVIFSNGKKRCLPNSEAIPLLALPVKERAWPI